MDTKLLIGLVCNHFFVYRRMFVCIKNRMYTYFWIYNKGKIGKYVQEVNLWFCDITTRKFLSYTLVPLGIWQPGCSLQDTANWYLGLLTQPFPWQFSFLKAAHRPRSQTMKLPSGKWCLKSPYWERSASLGKHQLRGVIDAQDRSIEAEYGGIKVNSGHSIHCLRLQEPNIVKTRKARNGKCLKLYTGGVWGLLGTVNSVERHQDL